MKSAIVLSIGLMAAGVAAAYSELSLIPQTTISQSILSTFAASPWQALIAGVAIIAAVSFREHLRFIDRKGAEARSPSGHLGE